MSKKTKSSTASAALFSGAALLSIVLSAACGGGSAGTQPGDMSADEHRAAARAEDEQASTHQAEEAQAVQPSQASTLTPVGVAFDLDLYDPREAHGAAEQTHRHLAEEHRQAAETLESFEEAECASFPSETRVLCPLMGQLASAEDVPGGVKLSFNEGVNVEAVTAHLRCHTAYAATHGREGMTHCPMYVEGAAIGTDEGAVLITTGTAGAVSDVRRRTRSHVGH